MWRVESRPAFLGNEPMSREWHTVHERAAPFLLDGPFLEVQGAWERREQHELRERHVGALSERHGGVEAVPGIAGEPENERTQHMDPVLPKRPQAGDEFLAGEIEPFVHVLEALRAHGLDADQRAADLRTSHG